MFDETTTTDIEETTEAFPYSIHKCWFWILFYSIFFVTNIKGYFHNLI